MIRHIRTKAEYYLTGFLAAALFFSFYGFRVLNPFYIDWILCGGDPTQHYLGWALFRYAPFRLQLGLMNTAAYPFDTSIIFTDSIPIMAIPSKFIGLCTDSDFQFFGIWGFICILLTGILTCFLFKRFIDNKAALVFASLLVTASPCMLRRIFWHSSLAAHFLIILALILIVYRNELCDTWQRAVGWWALIAFLCAFVHIYFLAMNFLLLLGYVLFIMIDSREKQPKPVNKSCYALRIVLPSISYLISAVISIWVLGGFSSGMSSGAPGLGYYSFNLNGFFDPDGWSSVFSNLNRYTDGQYEGFAYLGLGVIIALVTAGMGGTVYIIARLYRKNLPEYAEKLPVYIGCVAFIVIADVLVAASNEITLGDRLLVKYGLFEWIQKIWDIFRASGRLIWPDVYIIAITSIVVLSRIFKKRILAVALAMCVVFQIGDMYNVIEDKHAEFTGQKKYENRIDDPEVTDLIDRNGIKHIVFLDKDNLSQDDLYAFTELATRYRLTVNDFYFARYMNHPATEMAYHDILYSYEDSMFVISDKSDDIAYMFPLEYFEYNGVLIGVR